MAEVGRIRELGGDQTAPPTVDWALADLAARQHDVFSLEQAVDRGLGKRGLSNRVAAGRMRRLYPGVYTLGRAALRIEGTWMAAVLAVGADAALSDGDGAAHWGLRRPVGRHIHVTVPSRSGSRSIPGIRIHRVRHLHPDDVDVKDGIPVTSVARTLVDLAGTLDKRSLERAVDQAEILRIFDRAQLDASLARAVGRRGTAQLRAILASYDRPAPTRTELEHGMFAICRLAGVDRPRVNETITLNHEPFEVDFHWPAHRLIVETDGFETHGTRRSFEEDRRREQFALAAGWRLVRITWRQMCDEPERLALMLRAALGE